MAPTTARGPGWLAALAASALAALPAAAERAPEPNPPHVERPAGGGAPPALRVPRGGMAEWVLHESADGLHPDADEQQMVWLMSRARQDPSAEGLWLATSTDPAIAGGRDFFHVDLGDLQSGFDSLAPQPPAAFDRRLYDASLAHSLDMIALDQQTHDGQIQDVQDAGFDFTSLSVSIFAFSDSALNAHAALNIDWGNTANGIQNPPGHRLAIMGSYDNVGLALVPESSPATSVGPLVFSGAYAVADTGTANHFHRFLVGTVWKDFDGDRMYDPGEGFPGVTVTPDHGPFFAVTSPGGGYAFPVTSPGLYHVTFSGGGIATVQQDVTLGGDSELLDLEIPICGNGAREVGEGCDDGNTASGDCCSATCEAEFPAACDDGDACNGPDACTAAGLCEPQLVCDTAAAKTSLSIDTEKGSVSFVWQKGSVAPASLGDPTGAGTDFALCVRAGGASVLSLNADGGGTCGGSPCWKTTPTGFAFKSKDPGVRAVSLRASDAGKAKLTLEARSAALSPLGGALAEPVRARLTNGAACWEQIFTDAETRKNDGTHYKATRKGVPGP